MENVFPFAALVGLDTMKLALELSVIDPRLSVLLRGDKGAGKSTAARGLAELMPDEAPFINLPIGTTEDRLLGGLDIERTLKGEPVLKPGLVARAHGGVLYVDEVNLLADHLADALLDASASGVLVVEREGFSVSQPAEFVLLGSMNPEEGALRPQLLDRFALVVDVEAPLDPILRATVLTRRMAYDGDRAFFRGTWKTESLSLAAQLRKARVCLAGMQLSPQLMQQVAARVAQYGVRSLRADLAVVRASRAYAALLDASDVTDEHVEMVLPLALAHRIPPGHQRPKNNPPQPPPSPPPPQGADDERRERGGAHERVFQPSPQVAPRVVIHEGATQVGTTAARGGANVGPALGARRTENPAELDVRASVVHAVGRSGQASLAVQDLHERQRSPRASTRFILVVDSSGSHAVVDRMRLVKGVATGLLDASYGRHDEVVVIACRGGEAEVLVEPTSSREDADRALEYLPTGGRTPLAHGLELAAGYTTDRAVVIVITDGRANVPTKTDDAWSDAQAAASALRCPALVIDTEDARNATGRPRELAGVMEAHYARLAELDPSQVLTLVRGKV